MVFYTCAPAVARGKRFFFHLYETCNCNNFTSSMKRLLQFTLELNQRIRDFFHAPIIYANLKFHHPATEYIVIITNNSMLLLCLVSTDIKISFSFCLQTRTIIACFLYIHILYVCTNNIIIGYTWFSSKILLP